MSLIGYRTVETPNGLLYICQECGGGMDRNIDKHLRAEARRKVLQEILNR